MGEAAAHMVLGLEGRPWLCGWSQHAAAGSSGKSRQAHQHPPPQRRKFPLEPELASVSDRLGLGSWRDKEQAIHSGNRAGKVIAKQLEPTPGESTSSVWEGGPVLTDGGCQAAQLQRASMLERLQWAAAGCQGQGPRKP